ncbi:MAG: ankyrin repeat domain-containing protein [Waddliaceae bacterium]
MAWAINCNLFYSGDFQSNLFYTDEFQRYPYRNFQTEEIKHHQTVEEKITKLVQQQISSWDELLKTERQKATKVSGLGLFLSKEEKVRKKVVQSLLSGELTKEKSHELLQNVLKCPASSCNKKTGNPLFLDAYLTSQADYHGDSAAFVRLMLWTHPKSVRSPAQIKNKAGLTGWIVAVLRGNEMILRSLPKKLFQEERGADASTPLMIAAAKGHLQIVKFILSQRVDVGSMNQVGLKALDFAKYGQGSDGIKKEMIRLIESFESTKSEDDIEPAHLKLVESMEDQKQTWNRIKEKETREFRFFQM